MHTATTLTRETFSQIEEQAIRMEKWRLKKIRARSAVIPVGNIVFTFLFFVCTAGLLHLFGKPAEVEAANTVPLTAALWNAYATLVSDQPWFIQVAIALGGAMVIAVLASVIVAAVAYVTGENVTLRPAIGDAVEKANDLLERYQRINDSLPYMSVPWKPLTSLAYFILTVVYFIYTMNKAAEIDPATMEKVGVAMVGGIVIASALLLLVMILLRGAVNKIGEKLYDVKKVPDLEKAAETYKKACEKQAKEAEARR